VAVVLPAFDPRVTVTNTLSGGVNTPSRALLLNQSTQQIQAAQRLSDAFGARVAQALGTVNSAAQSATIDALTQQQSLLAGRRDRVTNTVTVVKQALTQSNTISSNLNYLQDQLDNLESGTITASQFATIWDNTTRLINNSAGAGATLSKDTNGGYVLQNLIGTTSRSSFSTQTLFAPYNADGQVVQIDGSYLGTDWYLTDGSSVTWNSNTGFLGSDAQSATLTGSDGTTSSTSGITFTSFDSSTDTATFTLDNGTTSVSGTVTRGGLGLLDSFLYGGFDTNVASDALDRAQADLNSAQATLYDAQASFRDSLNTLQSRADLFDTQIQGLSSDIADQITNLQSPAAANLASTALEAQVAQLTYALLAQRGNTLIKSLILAQDTNSGQVDPSATGSALLGARIDITA
jgi:hypothetical protein